MCKTSRERDRRTTTDISHAMGRDRALFVPPFVAARVVCIACCWCALACCWCQRVCSSLFCATSALVQDTSLPHSQPHLRLCERLVGPQRFRAAIVLETFLVMFNGADVVVVFHAQVSTLLVQGESNCDHLDPGMLNTQLRRALPHRASSTHPTSWKK